MTNGEAEILELLKTAEGQRQYVEWMSAPVAQVLFRAARERARPVMVSTGATLAEDAIASLNLSIGANRTLDYLQAPVTSAGKTTGTPLGPGTYGAKKLITTYGHEGPKPSKDETPKEGG